MKKSWLILTGVTLVLLVIGLSYAMMQKKDDKKGASNASQTATSSSKKACDYLTQAVADKVLGAGATKADNSAGDVSGDDVDVSTCTYMGATDSTIEAAQNARSATLLVRAPKTKTGEASNEAVFASPQAGSGAVTEYGKKAFWDPATGQFNVLSDNNVWFIMSVGKTKAADRTQTENTMFAGDLGLSAKL